MLLVVQRGTVTFVYSHTRQCSTFAGGSALASHAMFDVIVHGGRVVDPSQDLDAQVDVGIVGPRIAALGNDLLRQGVRGQVVDATGLIVTPGWIDLHTHTYWGVAPLGVDADAHCLAAG